MISAIFSGGPPVARQPFDVVHADAADQATVVDDREHAVVVAVDVVVDQLGDADPAGTATALAGHNAPHRHATQAFANHDLLVGRLRRGVHEQADQGVPHAAHEIAGQSLPDAERDGQDAERPADP